MSDTNWGYLQQKKKADELNLENEKLKKIIKKLLNKEELDDSEKEFLKYL